VYNLSPSIVQIAVTNANLIDNIFPNGVMSGLDILNTTHNLIEHGLTISFWFLEQFLLFFE
jgi:hypothetical protein